METTTMQCPAYRRASSLHRLHNLAQSDLRPLINGGETPRAGRLDSGPSQRRKTHQLQQALLKVVVVLALVAHELRDGAFALAQLAEAEGAQLVQLPAQGKPWSLPYPKFRRQQALVTPLSKVEAATEAIAGKGNAHKE